MIDALAEAAGRAVSRETFEKLERYGTLLREESARQNLVSASSLDQLWDRHLLDSAQLVRFAPSNAASWVDIGSGAGLPGIVLSLLTEGPVLLIEPRRLRAEFLTRVVEELELEDRVKIFRGKAEGAAGAFDMLTARAVARATNLLEISTHLSTGKSRWVLPKGRSAQSELAEARRNWHCAGEIVPSVTDPEAGILLLWDVKARGGR